MPLCLTSLSLLALIYLLEKDLERKKPNGRGRGRILREVQLLTFDFYKSVEHVLRDCVEEVVWLRIRMEI